MSKLLFDWLQGQLERFPLMTILLGVALAAAWMTEIHLTTQQASAELHELSQSVQVQNQNLWLEVNSQRRTTVELLQSIDRRLSRIEGKLER